MPDGYCTDIGCPRFTQPHTHARRTAPDRHDDRDVPPALDGWAEQIALQLFGPGDEATSLAERITAAAAGEAARWQAKIEALAIYSAGDGTEVVRYAELRAVLDSER